MKSIATSDVFDVREEAQVCMAAMRLLVRKRIISGRIRTIRCFEDNVLVKSTMAEPSEGEVLVVDGGGSLRTTLMGDMIAGAGCSNGWAGAVVIGAVRDSVALDALDFHVKCLGTSPRKSAKHGVGEHDVIIEFGDSRFVPGGVVLQR